ncbi:hypothetical protein WH47_02631, partial [Habropoda laboriosa]
LKRAVRERDGRMIGERNITTQNISGVCREERFGNRWANFERALSARFVDENGSREGHGFSGALVRSNRNYSTIFQWIIRKVFAASVIFFGCLGLCEIVVCSFSFFFFMRLFVSNDFMANLFLRSVRDSVKRSFYRIFCISFVGMAERSEKLVLCMFSVFENIFSIHDANYT